MRKLYAFTFHVKKIAETVVSALKKEIPPALQSKDQYSYCSSLYQLKPEYSTQKSKQMFANSLRSIRKVGASAVIAISIISLVLSAQNAVAQATLANYTYSTNTNGSLEDLSTGSTSLLTGINDDVATAVAPIGFNFTFMGVAYSHFSANSNGQFRFHTSSDATAIGTNVSTYSAGVVTLAPFSGDNEVGNGIRYRVLGTAPNRKLVVEWNQFYIYYTDITNAGNMQLWLDEATGAVTYMYGEIYNSTTTSQTRSIFIASSNTATTAGSITISATPTFALSATLATNTIAAGANPIGSPLVANIGSAANGSRRFFRWTPLTAPSAASAVNFTAISATGMTVNWTDNATNESGFYIYRSTDNVNFTLVSTSAANAVNYVATGLTVGTTYYWRVAAFNEGYIAANATGTQSTSVGTLSGTVTIPDTYATLTAAFAAVNANGLSGNLNIAIQSTYTGLGETYPIATSSANAAGAYTVTVYPQTSGRIITSNAAATIDFNGGGKVIFDGRVNATGTARDLEISNSSTTGVAVRFINEATTNTLQYCVLRGVNTSTTSGVVLFSTTTGTNGNDNNTITNCDIREGGANPLNGIYSLGTTTSTTHYNDNNTISNCNIYNFFGATSSSSAITVAGGNSGWSITGNSVYQTASRTFTAGSTQYGIRVDNTTNGNGFTVSNNFVGGTAASAGSTPYTIAGAVSTLYRAIYINVATGSATSVQGNTVANFAYTTASTSTTLPGVFAGIQVAAGLVNVGTVTGNTIGASTGTGSIVVTATVTGGYITGIYATSSAVLTIQNNTIGSISTNSAAAIVNPFWGINVAGSGAHTISLNNIGSSTTANSIAIGTSGTTTAAIALIGIESSSTGTPLTISSNNIYNLSAFTSGAATLHGIYSSGTVTTLAVNSNIVRDLKANSASGTIYGIRASTTQYTFSANQVYNLSFPANSGTSSSNVYGIYDAVSPTAETITNNIVNNLSIAGAGTSTGHIIAGIYTFSTAGTKTISGNVVNTLSFTNSSTGVATLHGILSGASTPSIFKNKIYDLSAAGATSLVNGITISSGTNVNVYNNLIGDLKAPAGNNAATDVVRGINIISATTASNMNISYNSIFLNGAGGAAFTTSGIFHTYSGTATTSALVLRNNNIVNLTTPGTGFAIGIRRSASTDLSNYSTASNQNNIYAGTPGANRLVYYDGTNAYQTLSAFKSAMGGVRESASITENPSFLSTTGSSTDFLHINTTLGTQLESGGAAVSGITDDFDGNTRNATTPDIGADEFAGTSPAPVNSGLTVPSATCIAGNGTPVSVNVTTAGNITGVTITYNNGTATGPVAMSGPDGTPGGTWTYTIPAGTPGATVSWSVTSTNDLGFSATSFGTSYSYLPLTGSAPAATASNSVLCAGTGTTLTATIIAPGTATQGAGAATSASLGTSMFPGAWGGAKTQYLIRKSELDALGIAAGNITSLGFTPTNSGQAYTGFAISMANATTVNGAITSSFVATTDVYAPGTSFTPVANTLNSFTFTTPFNWNGVNDIIISICWSTGLTTSTSTTVQTDAAGYNASYGWNVDSQTPATVCGTTGVPSGGNTPVTSTSRPKFILGASIRSNATNVTWDNGVTQVAGNPLVVTPGNTTTYSANITSLGCTLNSSTSPAAPTVTITVNPLPATPTNNTVATQCGTPTFAVTTAVSSPTIKWYTASTGGTAISSGTSLSYIYTGYMGGGATNTLYASVTDGNGCESPRLQINVVVNDPATLTISPSGTDNACVNEITAISVTSALGNFSSYIWSPTTNLYTDAAATVPYTGTSATTVYYKRSTATASELITLNGTDGVCNASASVAFTVSIYPTITGVSATPATLCSGNTVTLTGSSIQASAGSVTVGAGATTSTSAGINPFYGGYGGVKSQYILTQAELSALGLVQGNITSLGFDLTTAGSSLAGFTINMEHTSLSTLTSTIETVTNTVYTGTFSPVTTGINTINFTNPFNWNGTSNIIISICWSNNNTSNTVSTVRVDAIGATRSNARYVDSRTASEVCDYTGSATPSGWNGGSTTSTSRPKMILSGQTGVVLTSNYVWSWTTTLGAPAIANGATTSHVPVNAGPGAVTGTYTATATLNGCASTPVTSSVVTVNPPAFVPTAQPTSLILSPATTSVGINFTAATGTADGYLVVRAATQPTDPVNGTVYTAGATALGGTIVGVGLPPFADNSLTASTSYTYWVYSYNGTVACSGPVYYTVSPLTGSVTTCGVAPVSSNATDTVGTGFTAHWAVAAGAASYQLDVSTVSDFSSFVTGYNALPVSGASTTSYVVTGLANNTAYYYRVRATNGSCVSSNSATISVTTYTSLPWVEDFAALSAAPAGWSASGQTIGSLINGSGNSSMYRNLWSSATTGTFDLPVFAPVPGSQFLSYQYSVSDYNSGNQPVTYTASGWGSFQLQVSTDYKATWTDLGSVVTAATPTGYVSQLIDISAYAGTNVSFRINSTWTTGDYYLSFDNFNINAACSAPTTQATALNFPSVSSGSISGSFTAAAAPGATGYLVLRTAQGVAPDVTPVSGSTYTAGSSLGNATVIYLGTSTSFVSTGLNQSTTYRYTVYSYNGNCAGQPAFNTTSPLFGEAATVASQNVASVSSGSWKNPATWSSGFVPSRHDNVTISAGHTITIDTTAFDSTLTIVNTGALFFDATTAFTLTSGGNVAVNNGGSFTTAATGTQTSHVLSVGGNLNVADGATLDFSTNSNTAGARVTFTGDNNTTFSTNASSTVDLRTLTVNKGTTATGSTIEISGRGFTVQGTSAPATTADSTAHGFITLTNGQLKLSMTTTPTLSRLFATTSYTIGATAGLWLNSSVLTVQGMSGSSPAVNGSLRLTSGTLNVGRAINNSLSAGAGGIFNIEGGALNIAGYFTSVSDVSYTQSGGIVTVATVGNSTSSVPSFGFTSTATTNIFNMSGGQIILAKASTATTPFDYRNHSGTVNITGGELQFGNASTTANSTFVMTNGTTTSSIVAPAVTIGAGGVPQKLSVAGTTGTGAALINGTLTLHAGDTLRHDNTGGQAIRVYGNVVNNGAIIQATTGAAGNRFFFDSTGAARTYTGSGTFGTTTTPYPGISVTNPNGVDLSGAVNNIIAGRINLFRGAVTGGNKVTLGNAGTSAVFVQRGGIAYANAGTIDVEPVNNAGTGGFGVVYSTALNAVTSGAEVPTSRTLKLLQTSNTNTVTLTGGSVSTDSLVMAGGNIVNDAANLITVTGAAVNKVNRTSGWITGPVRITMASGTTTGAYLLPVGKTAYAGFEFVNPVTASAGLYEAEFFETPTGGSPGIQMVSLNETGYWTATDVSGTSFTSAQVRVTSPVTLNAGTDAIAFSTSLSGVYDYAGATSPNVPTNTLTSDATPLISQLGFFTIGTKGIPMVYDSSITFQTAGTVNVYTGSVNQLLIGVRVQTSNNNPQMTLNSMTFNLNGSGLDNLDNNISAITLYTTGNSSTFATTQQVGSQVIAPFAVPPSTFTINDAITLLPGANYFWLTVDIAPGATVLDTLDAECVSMNITDNNTFISFDSVPRVTAPAGNRVIKTVLNGDYSIGTGSVSGEAGHFATLTSAVAALNDVGVAGPVRFILTDSAYTTGTGETFPIVVNAYANASAVNTLTILPNTGVNAAVRGSATAIIKLNGTDYATIDGSNNATNSRNLTIQNTNTSSSAAIWIASLGGAGNGADNDVIKNTIVTAGSSTTSDIYGISSSATTSLTTAASDNNNLTIQNNLVGTAYVGISLLSSSTAALASDGIVVSGNTIGNETSASSVTFRGVQISYSNAPLISGNTIFNMKTTASISNAGIDLGAGVIGGSVVKNNINGIYSTSTSGYGAYGINFSSTTATTNVVVANNFISDIKTNVYSTTTTTFNAFGIRLTGGTNIKLYNNTVYFSGASVSTAAGMSANLVVTSTSVTGLDVRNNLFVNTTTYGTSGSFAYNVFVASGVTFGTINYNGYAGTSGTNTTYRVGINGTTARATLANWQTFTTQDANSKAALPVFQSAADLHLTGAAINGTNYAGGGVNIAAVTDDYDSETRANPPTIGADELIPCSGAVGGTAVAPVTNTFCGTSTTGLVITASGYSSALNGTYQWQSSTDNFATTPVDIVGATNPASYTIASAVSVTTYYRLKVTCTAGTTEAFSNVVAITINTAPLPTFTTTGESATGTVFCTPAPQAITLAAVATTPAAVSYQWLLAGTEIGGANSATYVVSVPNPQTGTYSLRQTYANGCSRISTGVAITTSPRPTATANATPLSLCSGSNITLTSTGTGANAGALTGTYTRSAIGYNPVPDAGTGTSIITGDDAVSSQQTLPFTFNYFGTDYTTFYASTNGFITLSTTAPGSANAAQTIPSTTTPNNVIAGVWSDMVVSATTSGLRTYTTGAPGSRVFTIHYADVLFYGSGSPYTGNADFYIQLFEGTNKVEVHVNTVQNGDNTDATTLGIENNDGSYASSPSGYNGAVWADVSSPVAFSFVPDRAALAISSYAWAGPAGSGYTAAVQNPTPFAATVANSGQYTITVTDAAGCPGTATTSAVVVNPAPTVVADSAAYRIRSAASQTSTLPYTATGSPTTYSIVWNAAALGQNFVNVSNASITASPLTINIPAGAASGTYTGTITVIGANSCVSSSDDFTITIAYANPTWTGNTSIDWNTGTNWAAGTIPASGANVTIERIGAFSPALQNSVTVGTLEIAPNNTVTIGGNTLTVNGGIINNTGTIIGSNTSNLVLGATSSLLMSAAAGQNVLKDLSINAGTTTLVSPLDITGGTGGSNNLSNGVVTVANGAVLASGGNLTFKSNASGTARLAIGSTSGGYVTGNVTVERYIPLNTYRAWRFLSVPTDGTQKIKQAWQEGATSVSSNPKPGFGTSITSNLATWSANGFDAQTGSPSMQRWNSAAGTTGGWADITATDGSGTTGNIATRGGYTLFVKGDRSIQVNGASTTVSATTLRTTGTLYTGDQPNTSVASGRFEMIGNTYVSPVNFLALNRVNMANSFYLWDPKLVTGTPPSQQLGGYVTFSLANGWVGVPNSSSYGTTPNTTIQSGEAILIKANTGGGSIGLREAAKIQGNGVNMFRPASGFEKLKANMYSVAINSTETMIDGNVSVFDGLFSNDVDGDDAIKLSNSGENLAIRRDGRNLVVEGRQVITDFDTTYFWMWNMRQGQQYKLELITENMNVTGRSAYLVDAFTNTTVQLDLAAGVTNYSFAISSDQASSATNRFKVVYRQVELAPVPVSFVSVNAQLNGAAVKVDWKVAGETGIKEYVVERSADGRNFSGIGNVTTVGNRGGESLYNWLDGTPLTGANFYRIKSVDVTGNVKYTYIVKVLTNNLIPSFTIAPNPVEGSVVNIQFKNQQTGRYTFRLLANTGETVFVATREHAGGNGTQLITLPASIARGSYQLEIISPDKTVEVQNLLINTLK